MFSSSDDTENDKKRFLLENLKEIFSEFKNTLKDRIENARVSADLLGISEQMQNAILDAQSKANMDFYAPPGDPNLPFYELMKIKSVAYVAENVFLSEIFRRIKHIEREGQEL